MFLWACASLQPDRATFVSLSFVACEQTLWIASCGICHFAAFPRLVTSERYCQGRCAEPQWAQQITGNAFQISLKPDWQIDNGQS